MEFEISDRAVQEEKILEDVHHGSGAVSEDSTGLFDEQQALSGALSRKI